MERNQKEAFDIPVFNRINKKFTLLFWITLIAVAIVAAIMHSDKKNLVSKASPKGIISFEMAGNDSVAKNIVDTWKNDSFYITRLDYTCDCDSDVYRYRESRHLKTLGYKISLAKKDITVDFLFIIFYVLLTIVIIIKISSLHKSQKSKLIIFFIALAIFAGVCDVIENIGMLGYLSSNSPVISAEIYSAFAQIKFGILLFFVLLYLPVMLYKCGILRNISDYIKNKTQQLWRYRVILLTIIIFSFPIWLMDQGQDLMVNINASDRGVITFMTLITITAFLNWYLSKLFFSTQFEKPLMPYDIPPLTDRQLELRERKVARFFGVITFLIPAFAILHALDTFKIDYLLNTIPPVVWLITSILFFGFVLKKDFISDWYQNWQYKYKTIVLLIILILLIIILPIIFRVGPVHSGENPASLIYVTLDLLLFTIAFLTFISVRRIEPFFQKRSWLGNKIGLPVYISSCLFGLIFLLVNLFPFVLSYKAAFNFMTLPVIICGIILYTLLFTILMRLSKSTKVNFTSFLFGIAILVPAFSNNEYHSVRTLNISSSDSTISRMNLDIYFLQWIEHRKNEIDSFNKTTNKPYPIFLISAYGGGIRAAAFTSMSLAYLDSSIQSLNSLNAQLNYHPFEHYVFSYSGSSGGTIGASVMCAYRYTYPDTFPQTTQTLFMNFYKNDFLTPVLSTMLGRDVWTSISSFRPWNDRAAVQEELWEKHAESYLHVNYKNSFFSYWDTGNINTHYEVPLLFANTSNVDTGLKGIMCPVQLRREEFPATIFINQIIPQHRTIALSTGAFLSARFPYISPSAKFGDGYHFIDAGLKDNSGAETSEQIYEAVHKLYTDSTLPDTIKTLLSKTNIFFLSISNSSKSKTGIDKQAKNVFELTAPIVALYNNWESNSVRADSTALFKYSNSGQYFRVWPDVDCIGNENGCYSPVLPLGWQISEGALRRLKNSISKKYPTQISHPEFDKIIDSCFKR